MKQLGLELRRWGGPRKGAGRKPKEGRAGVRHALRARIRKLPVHVNWRMKLHVYNLRSRRCFRELEKAFWAACDRFGMRIIHFSVQRNHIHLVVEAQDQECLARGMQGLGVRIAKALNRVMGQHGKVLADRYHAHVLRTPAEVRNAVQYVLRNHVKHLGWAQIVDPFSSAAYVIAPVAPATTWLMRKALGPPS
jgi:REP element-mobilizing transposase RayT